MVNAAEAYKRQQIMTATPEALTLMLYNGCLKFMSEGIEFMEKKDFEQANTSLQKAQNIISEFRITLDMQYDIAKQLMPLYNYTYDRLVEGNIKGDIRMLQESKAIISELRDAWAQAMKKARQDQGTQKAQGNSYVG